MANETSIVEETDVLLKGLYVQLNPDVIERVSIQLRCELYCDTIMIYAKYFS
jgi:hypothetical protein